MHQASSVVLILIVVFMEEQLIILYVHMYLCVFKEKTEHYLRSRLAVYVASISSIEVVINFIEECTFSPSGMMFFYLVTRGWNFTSSYVRIQSFNIRSI